MSELLAGGHVCLGQTTLASQATTKLVNNFRLPFEKKKAKQRGNKSVICAERRWAGGVWLSKIALWGRGPPQRIRAGAERIRAEAERGLRARRGLKSETSETQTSERPISRPVKSAVNTDPNNNKPQALNLSATRSSKLWRQPRARGCLAEPRWRKEREREGETYLQYHSSSSTQLS